MNLSFIYCRSVTAIGVLGLLLGSLNYAILAEDTTSASWGLRVTVSPTTGDYAIGQADNVGRALTANVAAKVDGHWLHARDYPRHSSTESTAKQDLKIAHEWTVRHTGRDGAPDLICTLHSDAENLFR